MSDETTPTTFEAELEQLEDVVRRLEDGSVGLEEAVALFEKGQAHLATCRARLAAVQGRIDELTAADVPKPADDGEQPF
jgi:exodeoxyribonuclease VII small subunit